MKRKVCILFFLAVLSVGSCVLIHYQNKASGKKEGEQLRIAAIMMDPEMIFWEDVWDGTRMAAEENDIALSEYPYAQYDENVASPIEMALLADVDGILLRSQDTPAEELYQALDYARKTGKIIVTLDVDAGKNYRDAFVSIDNKAAAEALAEKAAEFLPEGKTAVIIKVADKYMPKTAVTRVNAFRERFEMLRPKALLQILELPVDDGLRLGALVSYLQEETEVGLLVGYAPKVTELAMSAVIKLKIEGQVQIVGFSESENALDAVEKGIIQCLATQDPYQMGKAGVEELLRLCVDKEEERKEQINIPFHLVSSDGAK